MIAKVTLSDGRYVEVVYDTMITISSTSLALYLDNRMVASIPLSAIVIQEDMVSQIAQFKWG